MTVEALQTALAAEHAALYVYGFLGARTSESGQPLVFAEVADAYATHRAWRDLLTRRLLDEGAEPTPASPTYEVPTTPATARGVLRAAAGPRGRVRRDLRLRRREHDRRGPAVGHRGADQGGDPAGGVRRAPGPFPERPTSAEAARESGPQASRRRGTPEIFLDTGSRGPRWVP